MPWALVLAHVLLPSAVAAAAGFGAWRCWRWLRYARDPRLLKLMWFYGLLAASLVSLAIWTGQLAVTMGDAFSGLHSGNLIEVIRNLHGGPAGAEGVNVFLLAHHALAVASLGVAVLALSPKRTEGVMVGAVGLALFEPLILGLLALEAAMTLYLSVRAILNHVRRQSPGSLQVSAGFLLFFIGHLSFFLFHLPGGARTLLGDLFALVGIVLLVQLLPRPSA